ncbi:putative proline-tRNA ligase [Zancudomyces culisetae]|uniref:proline--tRNA ligase n=1 Tax=Zancudomyces culisetae TaxID=1213189 RepID=A0A1R1PNM2_ZANCU|nr:putative proline-tRNA ligase [Zancudomyces culisetae]|eukprot:OMH82550.1 putative proline-tRNA ligase [Zancudomyces culisetae]
MTRVGDIEQICEQLRGLGLTRPMVSHESVETVDAWAKALDELKKGNASAIEGEYQLTKTLILKPKVAKGADPIHVMVVAAADTAVNMTSLGKELKYKDLRFVNEDVLKGVFNTTKGSVSPFVLTGMEEEKKGCYILRPWAYCVWEEIQKFFDEKIKEAGVKNCYFPMFVSSKVLNKEKDHIEGFAPEVAWVTKAGSSDLEEPIAIRPTSETVMYPYFAKWIRSHRDLPLRINQWCSVVRWEFKNPQPFLRTREFLWQEGHCAHLEKKGADDEVRQILKFYKQVYEELLAVPMIDGVKSEKEKFAGGLYTTTLEGYIPETGRGIQAATSHNLGQNFSKMFNITVEDPSKPATAGEEAGKLWVWQTSWGLSTRALGVMVMVHGDDKGLVIPPRVCGTQVVVIPVGLTVKHTQEDGRRVHDMCLEIESRLRSSGIRAECDLRENYSPGFKYNHWELKGVPVRLEVGPKDLQANTCIAARRDTMAKTTLRLDAIAQQVGDLLETIQADMFARATQRRDEGVKLVESWTEFVAALNDKKLCYIPWCQETECEDAIKERSAVVSDEPQDERAPSMGAKSLCIPFSQPKELTSSTVCVHGGNPDYSFPRLLAFVYFHGGSYGHPLLYTCYSYFGISRGSAGYGGVTNNSCRSVCSAVNRSLGSSTNNFSRKSTITLPYFLKISLIPLPPLLLLTNSVITPTSGNVSHPGQLFFVGTPHTLNINSSCSMSELPGNNGRRNNISAKMHPTPHMSIALPYRRSPNNSSGGRYHRVTTHFVRSLGISGLCGRASPKSAINNSPILLINKFDAIHTSFIVIIRLF